jgi:hypothetical protein
MPIREIIAEVYAEMLNVLCLQNAEFFKFKREVHIVTTVL